VSRVHVAKPAEAKARSGMLFAGIAVTIVEGLAERRKEMYCKSWSAVLAELRSRTVGKRWGGPPGQLGDSSMSVKGSEMSAMVDRGLGCLTQTDGSMALGFCSLLAKELEMEDGHGEEVKLEQSWEKGTLGQKLS
jgi:hypothetical protein